MMCEPKDSLVCLLPGKGRVCVIDRYVTASMSPSRPLPATQKQLIDLDQVCRVVLIITPISWI